MAHTVGDLARRIMEKRLRQDVKTAQNEQIIADHTFIATLSAKYLEAKEHVILQGYSAEIDWQHEVRLESIDETKFLSEAAWVILCSGMREAVVRKHFHRFSEAFLWWESADAIVASKEVCRQAALRCFHHQGKVDAVLRLAYHLSVVGIEYVYQKLRVAPLEYLTQFRYIGPVTSCHLAKNLGVPISKPDRHLTRLSAALGFSTTESLCQSVAVFLGEPIQVVDLVFWRFATLRPNYIEWFSASDDNCSSSNYESTLSSFPL